MKELKFKPSDKILILAPHPDDEAIGCAGVLLKYGSLCELCVLTDGCLGNPEWTMEKTKNVRQKEFEKAMAYVGIKHQQMMGIKDGSLKTAFTRFKQLKLQDYNYILCPNPKENHCDHKIVYPFLKKIIDKAKTKIIFYEVWSPIPNPTHYVDISDIIEAKKELISVYKSQLKYVDYKSRILGLNHYRGMCPAVNYAEAYCFAK